MSLSCTINPRGFLFKVSPSREETLQTVPLQIQHCVPGHESSSQNKSV